MLINKVLNLSRLQIALNLTFSVTFSSGLVTIISVNMFPFSSTDVTNKNSSSILAQHKDTILDYTICVRIIVVAQSRLLLLLVTQDQFDIICPLF